MKKYLSLESLRGVAAIIVALFHSGFVVKDKWPIVAQGAIFVDFFFVLSGFVMFHAYAQKIEKGFRFLKYVLARFGRIYPLHLFVLLIWVPYTLIKGYIYIHYGFGRNPFVTSNLTTFFTNLLLIHSLGLHDSLSWNYPSWSISVEFFTYIFFFLVVSMFKHFGEHVYLLIASIVSYAALWIFATGSLLATYDFGLLRCFGGFFLGAWICAVLDGRTLNVGKVLATIIELGVIFCSMYFILRIDEGKPMQLASFLTFGVIVAVFVVQREGLISHVLEQKWMILLGTLSYSIYMLHAIFFAGIGQIYQYIIKGNVVVIARLGAEPLYALVTPYADVINIMCLLVIICSSYLTYRFIEKPAREKFRQLAEKIN